MGIEFATIGTIVFLFRIFMYLFFLWCVVSLGIAVFADKKFKEYKKYLWLSLACFFILFAVPSSVTPKLTLEPNLPRVEYPQSEIIIEKPKDRVEYLPGFVPMGEKSE